jgi:DNA-binding transcriptional LysR family regulator
LLNRTTRRLSLTEAGAELYRRSAGALNAIEDAELEVTRFQEEPRGTLRVSAPMSFSILHLGPILPEFLAQHPGLTIDLQLDDRNVDLVDEAFDVAIRIGRLKDSSLIARRIAPVQQVVCASPAYLARRGEPQTPEELIEHECILYTLLSTPREWRFTAPTGEPIVVPVRGALRANNGLIGREAAVAGGGIVMLPAFYLGEPLRAGLLQPVLCRFQPLEIAVHAVYTERRHLLPKVRAFVDFIAAKWGPEPPWDLGWTMPRADEGEAKPS